MRDLSGNALAKIAQAKGSEPVVIVDVNWHGNIEQYADKVVGNIPGKILEVSNLDAVVNIDSSSDTQEISIKLDDTDGSIKTIIDNHDIHKREVRVYQWYEGLSLDDRFLLFSGKINSPITWVEGDRTLSFAVVSNLEDNEIGYSAEEGLFDNMPNSVIGQAWPMCFGTTAFSKTLRLTARVKGTLADGLSFRDFALAHRHTVIGQIRDLVYKKWNARPLCNAGDSICRRQAEAATAQYTTQMEAITATLNAQPELNTSPRIIGGEDFKQGTPMYVKIGNTTFYGKITNNVFTFVGDENQHPNIGDFHGFQYITTIPQAHEPNYGNWVITSLDEARILYDGGTTGGKIIPRKEITNWKVSTVGGTLSYTFGGWHYNGNVIGDNAGYVAIQPGATVLMSEAEPQTYVVSIVPGTVLRVSAWAESEGQNFLQDVDPDDYRVYTEQYGDLTVTFLEISDALSKRRNFSWSDDVFVVFESDIGPNTVDILQYIIETYSDFTVDATTFDAVRVKVENYPSNFAILDRPELFTVLQEIAWQARCAIWLKNGVFFIQYLSEEPTPIDTITESDVELESLVLEHTPTEDLVTKMVCEWRESGLQEDPYKTILRHNVSKYGTHEQNYNFYIYDFADAVIKSATFWMIRYSNTWKQLKFKVPLTKLNIETFDAVTLDFSSNYVANVDVIAMVDNAVYNSEENAVEMMCWCPVRSGEMTPYFFAYPAQVDAVATFPTDWEIQYGFDGGNSPGKDDVKRPGPVTKKLLDKIGSVSVRPSEEDPYNMDKGEEEGDRREEDKGNPTPSDVGDSAPGPKTIYPAEAFGDPIAGAESISPEGAPWDELNENGLPYEGDFTATDEEAVAPGGVEDPNDLPDPDNLPENNCNSQVTITWFNVDRVGVPCAGSFTVDQVNAGYPWEDDVQGRTGFGPTITPPELFTFNTCEAAIAFKAAMDAIILGCNYFVGRVAMGNVTVFCGIGCTEPLPSDRSDGMIGYRPSPGQTPRTA